jgi:ubiquitin C-terminal hydrolase
MDVTQQMDVDEYFNMMCEKLEQFLKEKSQKNLLANIWAGKLTSQLICKGCPHRRERDETFFTISLDIKKKANILEALELYVKGEMLEQDNAYYCEKVILLLCPILT